MSRSQFSGTVDIAAPPEAVWCVVADVENWPKWTTSVSRVECLTPGPFSVGSRARVHQPKLPPAWWRVTELVPGRQFTWVSLAPSVQVTAQHAVESAGLGCRVTLSLHYDGLFGPLLARLTRRLNERYLAMEAKGLKDHCEQGATQPELRTA